MEESMMNTDGAAVEELIFLNFDSEKFARIFFARGGIYYEMLMLAMRFSIIWWKSFQHCAFHFSASREKDAPLQTIKLYSIHFYQLFSTSYPYGTDKCSALTGECRTENPDKFADE